METYVQRTIATNDKRLNSALNIDFYVPKARENFDCFFSFKKIMCVTTNRRSVQRPNANEIALIVTGQENIL